VERLHQENVQLAGQLGYYQMKVQSLEEQIKLLTADKAPEEQPIEAPAEPTQHQEEVPTPELSPRGRMLRSLLRRLGVG